jgi:hypothetical protein
MATHRIILGNEMLDLESNLEHITLAAEALAQTGEDVKIVEAFETSKVIDTPPKNDKAAIDARRKARQDARQAERQRINKLQKGIADAIANGTADEVRAAVEAGLRYKS